MIYDWAISLGIVSILVLGLVVTADVIFASAENNYALGIGLGNVASLVADHIDRIEGVGASVSQPFFYNHSFVGVQLPAEISGHAYSIEVTSDFVVATANVSGGSPLSSYIELSEPVHLLNYSLARGLDGASVNSTWLTASEYDCLSFGYGINFVAWQEGVILDGSSTFLTTAYAMDGHAHTCPL
ncbi:MAG: hypothetical protein M1144_04860 [Candidatus Thermoplasmatota archaeon]|nr:hypothetical protein [Candidatus Thermoplasmatota archaeon]